MPTKYENLTDEQREKAREATRRYRDRNREKVNAEARENQKRWRAENPEVHRARAKKWKAENYDHYLERHTKWRHANRERLNEYRRVQHYRLKYGLTPEERDAMLAMQGGCCKICKQIEPDRRSWAIDHCHTTEKIRGILCRSCNLALGLVRDDKATLKAMIEYLDGD